MLDFTSACYEGILATVFTFVPETNKDMSAQVQETVARLDERFRCGEKPAPGHSPMLGKLAFVEGDPPAPVFAALVAVAVTLFDYVCAKQPEGDYVVTAARSGAGPFKIGDRIPAAGIHLHQDKDIWK
jgi:hypothetical protein